MDHRTDSPQLLLDFLSYHETIKAHSRHTVDEYYLDMRNFFRYLKQSRNPTLADKRLDEIDIHDVDLSFIASITLTDIYGYLTYLSRDRLQHQNSENSDKGLSADPVPVNWPRYAHFSTISATNDTCWRTIPARTWTRPSR